MIEIQGKQYRNIQEQVQKNKDDIEWLFEHCGGAYVGGLNIAIDGNVIKTAIDPTFSNITVDNGTSGLYVNSIGDAALVHQADSDRWSTVRIIEGTPEMVNRSSGYQSSIVVGTQDIEIERKNIQAGTTERKSLFENSTKFYKHCISCFWMSDVIYFTFKSTISTPITTQDLFDLAYSGFLNPSTPIYSDIHCYNSEFDYFLITYDNGHWGIKNQGRTILIELFISDTVTEL